MRPAAKTVGVLGGMGPHATAAFFQKLVSLTPATKDWEHLRVIVDDNPHIPSRSRHVLYGEESPLPGMIDSCRKLEAYPVDVIAVPCNSAVVFLPEVQDQIGIPILNICQIAVGALAHAHPKATRVAAFGGHVTYVRRTYEAPLLARGAALIDHGADVQGEIERAIERLKLSPSDAAAADALGALIARVRREHGAEAVILACTEFGCVSNLVSSLPTIDSSLELARHTVAFARSTLAASL